MRSTGPLMGHLSDEYCACGSNFIGGRIVENCSGVELETACITMMTPSTSHRLTSPRLPRVSTMAHVITMSTT